MIELKCKFNKQLLYRLTFQVVNTSAYHKPLISAETCSRLNIIRVNAKLLKVHEVDIQSKDIVTEFEDVQRARMSTRTIST